MSKPLALAFVIVLLFVAVAGILIYFNVFGPPGPPAPPPPPPTDRPAQASPTPEPMVFVTPTPALWSSPTPDEAPAQPTAAVATPMPAPSVTATTTRPALTVTATVTPSASATPAQPTATPMSAFAFALDGVVAHDLSPSCMAQYLRGTVRDARGAPLEGVRIQASDLWGNVFTATTKGGPDSGYWDIVLSNTPNVWRLVILDAAGAPISAAVDVPHHQEGEFKNACTHLANWKRAW